VSADERIGSGARQQLAADLAVRGGRAALEHFHRARVSQPDPAAAATADAEIRQRLAADIATAFPDDSMLGGDSARGEDALYSWVVTPREATLGFGTGLPGFAVSIGVLRKGVPFVGAVYDPITRWLFTACAGRGAWLNDQPLHARPSALSRASVVAIGNPFEAGVPPFAEEWLRRYRLRGCGSTALHLCYVAMGALDIVYDHRASVVDLAGAAAVVLEAGGVITRANGSAVFPASPEHLSGLPLAILVGNRTSHAQALADVSALTPTQR
jgi:myo-inositol-1(or 4)-monophosphatase